MDGRDSQGAGWRRYFESSLSDRLNLESLRNFLTPPPTKRDSDAYLGAIFQDNLNPEFWQGMIPDDSDKDDDDDEDNEVLGATAPKMQDFGSAVNYGDQDEFSSVRQLYGGARP